MTSSQYNIACSGVGGRPFTISGYLGTDAAAGTYMSLDMNQPASATSPTDAIVPASCRVTDIIAASDLGATLVAGAVELIAGGKGTGLFIDVVSRAPSNAGRMPLSIPLRAGTQVRFKVVVALNDI